MSNMSYHGNWFLPKGKKYPGPLEIDEVAGKIVLELYSNESIEGQKNSITDNNSSYFHEVILGDGHGGPFTLYQCTLISCSLIGLDFYKTSYNAEYVIYGAHISRPDGLIIKSGKFIFPGLADWYDGWEHVNHLQDLEGKLTDINYVKSEKLQINEELELIFLDTIKSRIEEISFSYLISYYKSLIFNYATDVSFSRLLKDSVTFLKLLEFSNSKPLNRSLISIEISNEFTAHEKDSWVEKNDKGQYFISNFSLNKNKEIPKHGSHSAHMIFSNGKLSKQELNEIILKWFVNKRYSNIIEYYLDANNWFQESKDAVLSNVMFNNRFLNLIQGLEDYYRENYNIDNDQVIFNNNKTAVLKLITTDTPLKHWFNDTLKFTRYLRLEEKLEIIVKEFLPELIKIYGQISFDGFPKSAKDFRHQLSHGMNKEISLGDKLHLDYHIARFLLLMCILKSLEVKDSKRLLSGHFHLQRDMQQIINLQRKYSTAPI